MTLRWSCTSHSSEGTLGHLILRKATFVLAWTDS